MVQGWSYWTLLELSDHAKESCGLAGLAGDCEPAAFAFDEASSGDKGAVSAAVHEGDTAEIDRHVRVLAGCRCRHELVAGCEVEFARDANNGAVVCGGHVDEQSSPARRGISMSCSFGWNGGGHVTLLR